MNESKTVVQDVAPRVDAGVPRPARSHAAIQHPHTMVMSDPRRLRPGVLPRVVAALGIAAVILTVGVLVFAAAVPDALIALAFVGLYAWVVGVGACAYVQAVIRR